MKSVYCRKSNSVRPGWPADQSRTKRFASFFLQIQDLGKGPLKRYTTKRQGGQKLTNFKMWNHFEDILRSIYPKQVLRNRSNFRVQSRTRTRIFYPIKYLKIGYFEFLKKNYPIKYIIIGYFEFFQKNIGTPSVAYPGCRLASRFTCKYCNYGCNRTTVPSSTFIGKIVLRLLYYGLLIV